MNQLSGIIISVETDGNISLVSIEVQATSFSSLVIDTPQTAPYLQTGRSIRMIFKETEMSIGKGLSGGLSLRNRFFSTVTSIETGKILTKIMLDFKGNLLCSIITTQSARSLDLQIGDMVEGLVKTNEISLMETVL